jgi:DNA-binding SARP family transcriptional activator/tetratricopeptide (TPR) repeat protein
VGGTVAGVIIRAGGDWDMGDGVVELGLLGSVQVVVDGAPVELGPPRRRAVLAALAIEPGRPVLARTLIERVWGPDAPAGALSGLYAYLTRLRDVFTRAGQPQAAPRRIAGHGGFRLGIDTDRVDLHRFRRLVQAAGADRGGHASRAALFDEALALWRGSALTGLPGEWAERTRQQLAREQFEATLLWAAARSRAGQPDLVIDRMRPLVEEHPLVEPAVARLIEALGREGRTAEALECYLATRRRLVEELGTEPGPELRALHQALLEGDLEPALAPVARRAANRGPSQLPSVARGFTGRQAELAALDDLLADSGQPAAAVISAVAGMAGVGKTALGLQWAHRNADRFPDGQLYLDLRGFDASGRTVEPTQAIRGVLATLGAPADRMGSDEDALTATYRSMLAGQRMLIMLDNARDTTQVRPLLPGGPHCRVIVTSRRTLTGLIAADGARPVLVGLLDPAEATQLLAARIGAARAAAEPDAVAEIVAACAGLPLALAIMAARVAVRPRVRLATLAGELRDARARLGVLTADDPHTDLRAVFSWSYQTLPAAAARLFRLLGLHPGPDISVPAAASLAALPIGEVRPLLAALGDASLVAEHASGRYAVHDLLLAYAAELVEQVETGAEREAASDRLVAHYLHGALLGSQLLHPHQRRDPDSAPPPGVAVEQPADSTAALAWFDAEHRTLLATLDRAARAGQDRTVWRLAAALDVFLDRRGHWPDWTAVSRAGVDAATRDADLATRARAHRQLAHSYISRRHYDAAEPELARDVELCRSAGHPLGQGSAEYALARLEDLRGRRAEAVDHAERALALFRQAGDQRGAAYSLNAIGYQHARLGNLAAAATTCGQALDLFTSLGEVDGQARTWDSLAYVQHQQGRYEQAITSYQQARALLNRLGDGYGEATVLDRLGDIHEAAGDHEAACDTWQQSARLYGEPHPADAARVQTKLAGCGSRRQPGTGGA